MSEAHTHGERDRERERERQTDREREREREISSVTAKSEQRRTLNRTNCKSNGPTNTRNHQLQQLSFAGSNQRKLHDTPSNERVRPRHTYIHARIRSYLPGRVSALSSTSYRFVAAITITPLLLVSRPSIHAKSWFRVCSASSLVCSCPKPWP